MKVTIITPVRNRRDSILRTIKSLREQSYQNYEHIIIDGNSNDGTKEQIINQCDSKTIFISESDSGMYAAINKGLRLASGSVIGILNSDDVYAEKCALEKIMAHFQNYHVDITYGDIEYWSKNFGKKVRLYRGKNYSEHYLKFGLIPPHPTFYISKKVLDEVGLYNESFRIAGDFDLISRALKGQTYKASYIPRVLVRMEIGGLSNSSLKNRIATNIEILRSCRNNKIKTNLLLLCLRYPLKIMQYLN